MYFISTVLIDMVPIHCALAQSALAHPLCTALLCSDIVPISSQKLRWARGRSRWRQWGRVRWCPDRSKSLAQRGAVQWPMKSSRWWRAWPGPSTTHLHLTRQIHVLIHGVAFFNFTFDTKSLNIVITATVCTIVLLWNWLIQSLWILMILDKIYSYLHLLS